MNLNVKELKRQRGRGEMTKEFSPVNKAVFNIV